MKTSVRRYVLAAATSAMLGIAAQAADYPTTVLSHNPVGYWRFDETATSPPLNKLANSGSLGSIVDGIAVADVGKGQAGRVGNCVRLNNPGNTVAYSGSKVDVTYNANINPAPPFSVEFWAKPNGLGTDATGFCPLSSFNPNWFGGGNRSGYLFYLNNNGVWQFRLGTTSGYAGICTATSGNAVVGTWQHIVATYDGATARLYANGVLIGTASAPVANWTRNTQMALRIGGTPLTGQDSDANAISATGISGNRGFEGWMDEVAVYTNLLSASTVKAHFDAATTNNAGYGAQILADSPVGYWNMDEPAVTTPDPTSFPIVANSGSAGSAADGTNTWGSLTAQPGSGFAGLGGANKACFFDGENGYIALKDAPGLHFSGQVTLMAWVKPTSKDYFRDIIAHGWDGAFAETFLRISRAGGPADGFTGTGNYYEFGGTDGINYYDAAYVPIPEGDIGNWVFIAGSFDGANWNLYRNGVLAASTPADIGSGDTGLFDTTNRWSIGSRTSPSPTSTGRFDLEGLFFRGWIDEPAIFSTGLSAGDINAIYNSAQVAPVITRAVAIPANVFKNGSVSFDVWAEGSPTLTYSWTSNGVPVGGSTTNITLSNLAAGSLTVQVVAANAYGSATSSVSTVVVASKPQITQQPVAVTRYVGRPFQFSVAAIGTTPISYQWKTNGVDIPGATSSTYGGIASAALAANYSCVLSNEAGTSNSVSVALTVLPIPANYGGAVIADGPIAYWRLGESSGTVAHDYYGGHDGTYFSATLGRPGYSVIDPDTAAGFSGGLNSYVGNISGTEINFTGHTNFTLELWANGPSGQAGETTLIAKGIGANGTTATEQFSIEISGGNYRFFVRRSANTIYEADATVGPDGTWQHIVGVYDDAGGQMYIYVNGELQGSHSGSPVGLNATTSPVSIASKRTGNDPNYNGSFNGTVDDVAIYSYALSSSQVQAHYSSAYGSSLPPIISKQPVSLTNYVTLPGVFSVGAFGTIPLSYQWKKGATPLTDDGIHIFGANSASLTINPLVAADAGTYSVTITNVNGTTNSASVTLTVLSAPVSPPPIPGLVVHLPFDNNLTDTTGRGNSGTGKHNGGNAAAAFVGDGMLGSALHYSTDTNSLSTNYVSLGVRPDLQFGAGVPFTVSYWIRLPLGYNQGDLPFLCNVPNSTFSAGGFTFAPSYGANGTGGTGTADGGWGLSVYDSGGNGIGIYGDTHTIDDGNWHHLVHVVDRDPATAGVTTYLDGKVAKSNRQNGTTAGAAGDLTTTNATVIGQDPTGAYFENGSADIDDLGVWRKALTPLEAASIYVAATVSGQSFAGTATLPPLTIQTLPGGKFKLTWPLGTLTSATNVVGPYTPVSGATSPYTNSLSGAKFYRTVL